MGTCTSKSNTNKSSSIKPPTSIKKGNPQQAVPSMRTQTYIELEVPEQADTKGYQKTFDKFSNLMELLGDVSRLPQRTLQFVKKLFEAKKKVDESTESMQNKSPEEQRRFFYKLFIKFHKPINELIA